MSIVSLTKLSVGVKRPTALLILALAERAEVEPVDLVEALVVMAARIAGLIGEKGTVIKEGLPKYFRYHQLANG